MIFSTLSQNMGAAFLGLAYLENMLADVGVTVTTALDLHDDIARETSGTLQLAPDISLHERCRIMFETWLARVAGPGAIDGLRLTRQSELPPVLPALGTSTQPSSITKSLDAASVLPVKYAMETLESVPDPKSAEASSVLPTQRVSGKATAPAAPVGC